MEQRALGPNHVAFVRSGDDTGGTFSLTDFRMAPPPAPGPPPHVHEDADECVYVLEGPDADAVLELTRKYHMATGGEARRYD